MEIRDTRPIQHTIKLTKNFELNIFTGVLVKCIANLDILFVNVQCLFFGLCVKKNRKKNSNIANLMQSTQIKKKISFLRHDLSFQNRTKRNQNEKKKINFSIENCMDLNSLDLEHEIVVAAVAVAAVVVADSI